MRRLGALTVATLLLAMLASPGCAGRLSAQACKQCVEQTRDWLGKVCAARAKGLAAPLKGLAGQTLAQAKAEPFAARPAAPVVVIEAKRMLIDGRPYEHFQAILEYAAPDWKHDPKTGEPAQVLVSMPASVSYEELPDSLKEVDSLFRRVTAIMLWLARRKSKTTELVVAITRDTYVTVVAEIVTLSRAAGYTHVTFLFATKPAPGLPTAPDAVTYARAAGPKAAGVIADELGKWRAAGCRQVADLYGRLPKAPSARCQRLARALPDALARCRCDVDEKPLLSATLRTFEPVISLAAHRVRLDEKSAPVLVKNTRARWKDMAARIAAADAKGFWLKVQYRRERKSIGGGRGFGIGGRR